MMLGEIVAKVCCPRFLEMAELALYGLASEWSQWKCMSMDLGAFTGNVVGDDAMCRGVVGLHGPSRLFVAHLFERM